MENFVEVTDAVTIRELAICRLLYVGYPATRWEDDVSLDQIKDWIADGTVFLIRVED